MIRRIDLRGTARSGAPVDYRSAVPRAEFDVEAAAAAWCDPSATPSATAASRRSSSSPPASTASQQTDIPVPPEALAGALAALDPAVRAGLEESIRRLRATCEAEREADVATELGPGAHGAPAAWCRCDRVGLYVPGGLAPLVSSVLMNVVPAQVAGVASIALSLSPQAEHGGLPAPDDPGRLRAARRRRGVRRRRRPGDRDVRLRRRAVPPRRPGDRARATSTRSSAKRLLKGVVGIDSEAGPTEIAILADDTADPAYVAADLLSQAEHDPLAAAVLVTPSERLADEVEAELDKQVSATRHVERIRTALAGRQSGIVLVDDLEQGLAVVNAYAAEHLEIQTARRRASWRARVRNAGAVFVGPFAPVSLGDYCAGSNHVLPTAGCACHSSGLSVRSFLKAVHVVDYTRDALAEVADHVVTLADAEDLPGHGAAVRVRFED